MRQLLLSLIEQAQDGGVMFREFVHEARKEFVTRVLVRRNFNQSNTARELGVHRNTVPRLIAELGIDVAALRAAKAKPVQRVPAITEAVKLA